MSEQSFLKALHMLATLSQTTLTPEIVGLYHSSLSSLGFDKAASAMRELAKKTSPKSGMPTVEAIEAMLSSGNSNAGKFDELISLVAKHGRYRPPVVDAAMAKTINRLGGWQRVCDWELEELPYRRKDFDTAYQDTLDAMRVGNSKSNETFLLVGEHSATPAKPISDGQITKALDVVSN